MRRFRPVVVYICCLLAFAGLVVWMLYGDTAQGQRTQSIAVVVYGGENNDRWRSLEQGVQQACAELGIERPALTISPAGDADRQMSLISRELAGGADGLLVAVDDDETMRDFLEQLQVPVVAVLTGAGEVIPCVSGDNAAMGREMADRAASWGGSIAVLGENLTRRSVAQRYDAFLLRLEELGVPVTVLRRESEEDDLRALIASGLAAQRPGVDTLVVLDNDALETAIDAAPAAMVQVRICGIGTSEKVVNALDQGLVEELLFQNEYAAGYLAVMELAGEMGLGKARYGWEIPHRLVRRDELYLPENERLLFPIIQ